MHADKRDSPRLNRREEISRRLLDTVERLLQDGERYTELTVERIVSEAGIARSTFYVYFENKDDLLAAWFAEITARIKAAAARWWSLTADATREDLRAALGALIGAGRPHAQLIWTASCMAEYDPAMPDVVTEMIAAHSEGLQRHIEAGQADGLIDGDLPPAQTAAWLSWMIERGLHAFDGIEDPGDWERLLDACTAIVWKTLYASTTRPR